MLFQKLKMIRSPALAGVKAAPRGAGRTRTQVNTNSQPEKQNTFKYVAEK